MNSVGKESNLYGNLNSLSLTSATKKPLNASTQPTQMHMQNNSVFNNSNINFNSNQVDTDEQFVLDVIRTTKQESIQNLVEMLRLQESKSVVLIRILERYKQQLDNKELLK
jgi:hypothetical protein